MKKTMLFLLISALQINIFAQTEKAKPVVMVTDAGWVTDYPFSLVDEKQASLEIENAQGVSVLEGSYAHPYGVDAFKVSWQPGVDVQRSQIEITKDRIRFLVHFTTPVSSDGYQKVFTAKPVSAIGTSPFPYRCAWIEAKARDAQGNNLSVELHSDPIWEETDFGIEFYVYAEGFPSKVEGVFLSAINGMEYYPLVELYPVGVFPSQPGMVRYIPPGGIVTGISSPPYFPLSFIVKTEDGKSYAFNYLSHEEHLGTVRLVYEPAAVHDWGHHINGHLDSGTD